MEILNEKQIQQKIRRLAVEILERNFEENEIYLIGINQRGLAMAQMLLNELLPRTTKNITLSQVLVNPTAPAHNPISLGINVAELAGKTVIFADDVANTGRTIFYAMKPLFDILPKKVELAVLLDRKHKSFPIQPDYVGLSLATTFQENIDVRFENDIAISVYLN